MRIPIYSFQVDFPTPSSSFNPLLLFAQKYLFGPKEQCPIRICYASAIILIEEGKGTLMLNHQTYHVEAGTLIYIAAGDVHQWTSNGDEPLVQRCAYFDWTALPRPHFQYQKHYFEAIERMQQTLLAPSPQLLIRELTRVSNIAVWISYFNSFTPSVETLANRNDWDFLRYNGAFQSFLHQFLSYALAQETQFDARIQKILSHIEYVSPHFDELKLYEWAEELGLGKSRFHELFKRDTGYTPNEYLTKLQMQRIAEELIFSSSSVTELAEKYGYSSIHYFSKAFRKATGLSPTQYREKFRY